MSKKHSAISHKDYIGKTLRELAEATPNYAIGMYGLYLNGDYLALRDELNNEGLMSAEILWISELYPDHTYDIKLKSNNTLESLERRKLKKDAGWDMW